MLKSIIDQLRAHRDRLDAAITSLEAVDEGDPIMEIVPRHKYQRRKIRPIVLGSKTKERVCGRPGCGKTLGPNNTSGYCEAHWYDTIRKTPYAVGHQTTKKHRGRPGPRSVKERHEMALRMKRMWAEGVFGKKKKQ